METICGPIHERKPWTLRLEDGFPRAWRTALRASTIGAARAAAFTLSPWGSFITGSDRGYPGDRLVEHTADSGDAGWTAGVRAHRGWCSYRDPKKPNASLACASGAATATSCAVIGLRGAQSRLPPCRSLG